MKKICLMLLLTLTSCTAKRFATEYVESDADEQDYWRRIEDCGFKFPKPSKKISTTENTEST